MTELLKLWSATYRKDVSVYEQYPWDFNSEIPTEATTNKAAFAKWSNDESTRHCFYSGYEGVNPGRRIGKDNPAQYMRALVADYDVAGAKRITPDEMQSVKQALPELLWPTFAHPTMSGGCRLVWVFDRPICVALRPFLDEFLRRAKSALKLERLLPGLDDVAFKNSALLFDVWKDWTAISGNSLPSSLLEQWSVEAGLKLNVHGMPELKCEANIPMSDIEAEVHSRFPGKWQGEFTAGARGVVFFEDDRVNPTSAVVTEAGMLCFSTDRLFYSWGDIFGKAFVDKYVQDALGNATVDMYYDGKSFWHVDGTGRYVSDNMEIVQLSLMSKGLSNDKVRGENLTPVKKAIVHVTSHKRVDAVLPMVYEQRRDFIAEGRRVLNISQVAVVPPDANSQVYGAEGNFPWLSQFFDSVLDDEQRPYFFAWWQRFYQGALIGKPNRGHAMFLAGPVGGGKTFLSTKIISKSMGGHYPATKFLLGETQFNKGVSETGVLSVDDAAPATQDSSMAKFADKVKQLVVNPSMEVRAMYRDGVNMTWSGRRLVVTLNTDPTSLRMLPLLDNSIDDKVMYLLTQTCTAEFSSCLDENDRRVDRELPCFLRWLLDWGPPAHVIDRGRLAVKRFIHPTLKLGSLLAHGVSDLLQVVDIWFERRRTEDKDASNYWEGTSAELLSSMNTDVGIKDLVRSENVRTLGRKLGLLVSVHSDRVEKVSSTTSRGETSKWRLIAPWHVEAVAEEK